MSTIVGSWGAAAVTMAQSEKRGSIEDPGVPLNWMNLAPYVGIETSTALPTATPKSVLRLSAVLGCVQIISRSLAKLPLHVYRRLETGGKEKATDHPLYSVLKSRPHPRFSAFDYRHQMTVWRLLWGNAFAEIVRRADGTVERLFPIEPWRVEVIVMGETLRYKVAVKGGYEIFESNDILHLKNLGLDGVIGESVISYARKSFQSALAAQDFDASFNAKAMRPSAVLKHPGKLSPQAEVNLRSSVKDMYSGSANAGNVLILQEGVEATPWTMPLADAQWIERSYLSIEDICRLFGVPPHKVQHLLRATNNNIEQQSQDFLSDVLDPDLVAEEQELEWKLLAPQERESLFVKFQRNAAIQMDSAARSNFYEKMTRIGGMSIDEVRDREEFNMLPEDRGTVHYVPSSQMPAPTPAQADKIVESWAAKKASGTPEPKTDGQVAGNTGTA
jgi:HK97 family phage portal protein